MSEILEARKFWENSPPTEKPMDTIIDQFYQFASAERISFVNEFEKCNFFNESNQFYGHYSTTE